MIDLARLQAEHEARTSILLAVIAHDVANVANNMHIQRQLLARRLPRLEVSPEMGEVVEPLLEEVGRLCSLVDDLRTASGRGVEDHDELCLVDAVRYAVARVEKLCAGRSIELELPAELPLQGRRSSLDAALVELLRNAVEAGEAVSVTLRSDGEEATLIVADDGPGPPSGIEPLKALSTTKDGHRGLGLSLVKNVVIAHRGSLALGPREPRGTDVKVSLPLPKPSR